MCHTIISKVIKFCSDNF